MPSTLYSQDLTNQLELMQTWSGCELFWVPGLNSLLLLADEQVPSDQHEAIWSCLVEGCSDFSSRHLVTNLNASEHAPLFEALFGSSRADRFSQVCPQTQLITVSRNHPDAMFSALTAAMDHIAAERGLKRDNAAAPAVGLRKVRILEEVGAVLGGSIAGVAAEVERPDGALVLVCLLSGSSNLIALGHLTNLCVKHLESGRYSQVMVDGRNAKKINLDMLKKSSALLAWARLNLNNAKLRSGLKLCFISAMEDHSQPLRESILKMMKSNDIQFRFVGSTDQAWAFLA
ncbi:MAG: hypothetical protein LW629_08615 [Burkholderiales bacterium]|jgi:hypothetical protein|nr:hypothetical protein [Burkholderiales bacterium]